MYSQSNLIHPLPPSPHPQQHKIKPGKDGSEAFEDVGHSPDARELQQQYLIGEVTEPAAKRPKVSFYQTAVSYNGTHSLTLSLSLPHPSHSLLLFFSPPQVKTKPTAPEGQSSSFFFPAFILVVVLVGLTFYFRNYF